MDLGIVVPRLEGRGETEAYLRTCLERWQPHVHVTLYTEDTHLGREAALGIDPTRTAVVALPASAQESGFPAAWASRLHDHDAYLFFETPRPPRHFRPSVWCTDDGRVRTGAAPRVEQDSEATHGPQSGQPAGNVPASDAPERASSSEPAESLLMRLCLAARR